MSRLALSVPSSVSDPDSQEVARVARRPISKLGAELSGHRPGADEGDDSAGLSEEAVSGDAMPRRRSTLQPTSALNPREAMTARPHRP